MGMYQTCASPPGQTASIAPMVGKVAERATPRISATTPLNTSAAPRAGLPTTGAYLPMAPARSVRPPIVESTITLLRAVASTTTSPGCGKVGIPSVALPSGSNASGSYQSPFRGKVPPTPAGGRVVFAGARNACRATRSAHVAPSVPALRLDNYATVLRDRCRRRLPASNASTPLLRRHRW